MLAGVASVFRDGVSVDLVRVEVELGADQAQSQPRRLEDGHIVGRAVRRTGQIGAGARGQAHNSRTTQDRAGSPCRRASSW